VDTVLIMRRVYGDTNTPEKRENAVPAVQDSDKSKVDINPLNPAAWRATES
jgi:hypothetical protein